MAPSSTSPREVLVVVHPTWVFETREEIPSRHRNRILSRASLILHRIEDYDGEVVIVGPYNLSCLDDAASGSLSRVVQRSKVYQSRGTWEPLRQVGQLIAEEHGAKTRYVVAGFYRDLCCSAVADGLRDITTAEPKMDRSLSMAIPSCLEAW